MILINQASLFNKHTTNIMNKYANYGQNKKFILILKES